MKQLCILFLLPLFISATAGNNISNEQLAGNWKMTEAKVTSKGKTTTPKTKDDCYLCDIYLSQSGLVFTADGKVNYSGYGNPNEVRFEVNGNVISFYTLNDTYIETPDKSELKQKNARTSVEFNIALHDNLLTLTRVSPFNIETYTLTK